MMPEQIWRVLEITAIVMSAFLNPAVYRGGDYV